MIEGERQRAYREEVLEVLHEVVKVFKLMVVSICDEQLILVVYKLE